MEHNSMTVYIRTRADEDILGVYEDRDEAYENLKERGIGINTVEVLDLDDVYEREAIEIQLEHDDRVQADNSNDPDLYVAYASVNGVEVTELHEWVGDADEAYFGSFASNAEFAEEIATRVENISDDWPYNHIDWDAAADDLLEGDYSEENGYFFRNN